MIILNQNCPSMATRDISCLNATLHACLSHAENNGSDGCALFFRSEKIKLVKRKDLTLKNVSGGLSNQVAMLAELQFTQAKKKDVKTREVSKEDGSDTDLSATSSLYIAVTHFKAKAAERKLREVQGKHLIEEVIEFSSEHAPIIITGDFNSPGSVVTNGDY